MPPKQMLAKKSDLMGYMYSISQSKMSTRRSRIEFTNAESLTPWENDIMHNFAQAGANNTKGKKDDNDPTPYSGEKHHTRYSYGFSLNTNNLFKKSRALHAIEAISELGNVGGNHSSFKYDFSPDVIIVRITNDLSPRFLGGVKRYRDGSVDISKVCDLIENGDIGKDEVLIIGRSHTKSIGENDLGRMQKHPNIIFEDGIKNTVKLIKKN